MSIFAKGVTLRALLQNPDLLNYGQPSQIKDDPKKKDPNIPVQSSVGQSAFLGPNIWDQTLPTDLGGGGDFLKLEHLDLDDFLSENDIPSNEELNTLVDNLGVEHESQLSQRCSDSLQDSFSQQMSPVNISLEQAVTTNQDYADSSSRPYTPPGGNSPTETERLGVQVNFKLNDTDVDVSSIPGEKKFDPRKRTFSVDELRPQPVIKKSKKIYVTEEQKDDKYWQRRKKNNVAAKRSRDARRIKENQITLRAGYLETENNTLKAELKKLKKDNEDLKLRLSKYEKVHMQN